MAYTINFSPEFKAWWDEQDRDFKKQAAKYFRLLEEHGANLHRPYADTLEGSSLKNLKELRVQHAGDPYRLLYAFDPKREALLLIGGNKTGNKRWYKKMIPIAETIFKAHLEALEQKDEL